jgi:uncharacterized membrane protein
MRFIQDHVSFTLMWFLPVYWLLAWLTGTYTLLLIQLGIILFGAWGIFKLVELRSDNRILPFLAGICYFLILGRWTSFVSDCNFAIMASSMVPVFMYFFEKKKWIPASLCYLFILTSREDMALWVLFIGLFFLVTYLRDKRMRWASLLVIFFSLGYFIIVFSIIIPAVETPMKTYSLFNYSALGENPREALSYVLHHPFRSLGYLFINQTGDPAYDHVKAEFYTVYLISGGFLLLLRPKYLILFIPIIAKKMLNDEASRWSLELYYSIEFVSLLPAVAYLIVATIRRLPVQTIVGIIVCLAALTMTIMKFQPENRALPWWPGTKYTFYKPELYSSGFHTSRVHDLLREIPEDASVCASGRILPHMAFREKIYYFPRVSDADYLVVLTDNDFYPLSREQFDLELGKYLDHQDWKVMVDEDPLLILEKVNRSE